MASPTNPRRPQPLPSDPLELADRDLERLRDADDWEEPTRPQVMINIPAAALPPPSERRTRPETPAATLSASPPGTHGVVITLWRRLPPWGGVVVAVTAIVAYTVLGLAGKLPSWALP